MWLFLLSLAFAQEAPLDEAPPDDTPAVEEEQPRLEISFGSGLLFVEQAFVRQGFPNQTEQRVVPVPAFLLLGEYIWTPRWSSAAMLNVPLSTVRRIDPNGDIYEQHSAAAAGVGMVFTAANVTVLTKSTFRPQVGLLGCRTLNDLERNVFFPLLVSRMVLVSPSGSSLYGGLAYAFQEETLALLYGVGHRF